MTTFTSCIPAAVEMARRPHVPLGRASRRTGTARRRRHRPAGDGAASTVQLTVHVMHSCAVWVTTRLGAAAGGMRRRHVFGCFWLRCDAGNYNDVARLLVEETRWALNAWAEYRGRVLPAVPGDAVGGHPQPLRLRHLDLDVTPFIRTSQRHFPFTIRYHQVLRL